MGSTRARIARIGVALVLGAVGVLGYEAVTQVAGAVPPPVVTTDYAAYPPPLPASCTGPNAGDVLVGYRAFLIPLGGSGTDPGGGGDFAGRSLRRFQDDVVPGDTVVIRWDAWQTGCGSLPISFPLKATVDGAFNINNDQMLFRSPNVPPAGFRFCWSDLTLGETCPRPGGGPGFELSFVVPQLRIVCGYQLDVIIGGPLEIVGPNGSYYSTAIRAQAQAMGLGTFNTNGPSMLIDAANGSMPCVFPQEIVVNKQWVGTGSQPPSNVPPGFQLVVTSSVSDTDASEFGRATCSVVGGVFACDYRNAAGGPQGGLLVNNTSLLTVTETGFDGNTVDVTFPVELSSQFVACPDPNSPCQFTITNTPPPPPPPPPPTTAPTPTTIPPIETSVVQPPPTPPETLPPTLPATGSTDATPLVLFGLVLMPIGVTLVALTRRRARAN
jgi:hypothetical protein